MNSMSAYREKLSLVFSVLVLVLLTLSFAVSHRVHHSFEFRFAISGVVLLCITLYYRFLPSAITILHRALYRISAVMTFWAFGFFFFPTPHLVLYFITLPAFYFLFRIETKKLVPEEDRIACGALLALGTLLYIQYQPLQVLLFSHNTFGWHHYYSNAPVLILTGLGFIRLHRHSKWEGLCLLGTITLTIGLVLSTGLFFTADRRLLGVLLCTIGFAHLLMLIFSAQSPLQASFQSFSGLKDKRLSDFVTRLWLIMAVAMQVCLVVSLLQSKFGLWSVVLALAASMFLVHHFRKYTVSLILAESLAIFWFTGLILYPQVSIGWQIPSAAVLVGYVVFIRRSAFKPYLPNKLILLLAMMFYLQLWSHFTADIVGLICILFPFGCWISMPNRPMAVPRQYHWFFWPVVSAIVTVCLAHGYDHRLLSVWAMSLVIPPAVALPLLRTRTAADMIRKYRWYFLQDWADSGRTPLFMLTLCATAVSAAAFGLNYRAYAASWTGIWHTLLVFVTGIAICLAFASKHRKVRYVMLAEFLTWASLGLLRWKISVITAMDFGSPVDGYILLAAAVITAGIREVIRERVPEFSPHFQRATLFYGLAGWAFLQAVQLINSGQIQVFDYHGEISSAFMAMLTFRLAQTVHKRNLIYAFFFANSAILLYFYQNDHTNLMFYVTPLSVSALVLVQLFKDHLPPAHTQKIRLGVSLLLCGTSAFYNILDFNVSVWHAVIATLVALAVVLVGISLRIRIYLYLGTAFAIVNSIGVVAHIIINQPPENTTLLIGLLFLATGILFTVSFLVFQMKRQQILIKYQALIAEINTWE